MGGRSETFSATVHENAQVRTVRARAIWLAGRDRHRIVVHMCFFVENSLIGRTLRQELTRMLGEQAFASNKARLAGNNNIFGGFLYEQK